MTAKKMCYPIFISLIFILCITPGQAQAVGDIRTDQFQIDSFFDVTYDVNVDPRGPQGTGTGYDNGAWFRYAPQIDPATGNETTPGGWAVRRDPFQSPAPWWNQWFYNDPLIPGGKRVRLELYWDTGTSYDFDITINWSNRQYPFEDRPPMPDQGELIERLDAWHIVNDDTGQLITDWFYLPIDYNPVWVSIDIRGYYGFDPSGQPVPGGPITGVLEHQCVPVPGAFLLLASGMLFITGLRRKP